MCAHHRAATGTRQAYEGGLWRVCGLVMLFYHIYRLGHCGAPPSNDFTLRVEVEALAGSQKLAKASTLRTAQL